MQKITLSPVLLCLTLLGLHCSAPASLQKILSDGIDNAYSVQIQKLRFKKSHNSKKNAYSALLPTLSLSAGRSLSGSESISSSNEKTFSETRSNSLSASANWTIWDNYNNIRNITITNLSHEEAKLATASQVEKFILESLELYYSFQISRQKEEIIESTLTQSKWRLKLAETIVKQGAGTKSDILDAEIQLMSAEKDLFEFKRQMSVARGNLIFKLNASSDLVIPNEDLRLNSPYFGKNFEQRLEKFKEKWKGQIGHTHPDLKIQQLSFERAKESYQQVRMSYFPSLSLSADHTVDFSGYVVENAQPYQKTPLKSSSLSLNLSWTFFDWFQTSRAVSDAYSDLQISEIQQRNVEHQTKTQFQNLLDSYELLGRSLRSSRLIQEKAKTQYAQMAELYKLGRASNIQLRLAIQDLAKAEISFVELLKSKYIMMAQMLYFMGYSLNPNQYSEAAL